MRYLSDILTCFVSRIQNTLIRIPCLNWKRFWSYLNYIRSELSKHLERPIWQPSQHSAGRGQAAHNNFSLLENKVYTMYIVNIHIGIVKKIQVTAGFSRFCWRSMPKFRGGGIIAPRSLDLIGLTYISLDEGKRVPSPRQPLPLLRGQNQVQTP